MLVVERYFWAELHIRGGDAAVAATSLLAYLDDLTIVTETKIPGNGDTFAAGRPDEGAPRGERDKRHRLDRKRGKA